MGNIKKYSPLMSNDEYIKFATKLRGQRLGEANLIDIYNWFKSNIGV